MQLSLKQTTFQKLFLRTVTDEASNYYKVKLRDFSITAELDHSVTTSVFNLIQNEIKQIKDTLSSLAQSYSTFEREKRVQRKKLLSQESNSSFLSLDSLTQVIEFKFSRSLRDVRTEYDFLHSTFVAHMDKLFTYMGLYEELYLVNSLHLSLPTTTHLDYTSDMFVLTKGSSTISFQVFPIFFVVKYLLSLDTPDRLNTLLLEYLLTHTPVHASHLLTIADTDQILVFFDFCTMQYLSGYALQKMQHNESVVLPPLSNISKLHL